ncbi:NEW3 domain-containing protein [Botrimarina mediterranea]|uniref:NEW3 domain-containing protein n=1 Tax=Botrimarina mediterranea TaxID=2528022 RepID=UPI00118AE285|nr:Large cysteine-rich periplasmic protein OmcB precursor [Planctomycetes bacterium K2D]
MDRQRLIVRFVAFAAAAAPLTSFAEEKPPAPWAASSASSQASVADWANQKFASTKPAAEGRKTPAPFDASFMAKPAPAGDRYGAPATTAVLNRAPENTAPQNTAAPNAMREAGDSRAKRLSETNPLRGGNVSGEQVIRVGATSDLPSERKNDDPFAAFSSSAAPLPVAATPVARPAEHSPTEQESSEPVPPPAAAAAPNRIEIGATPVSPEPTPQAEPEAIAIAPEAMQELTPVERAPVERAPMNRRDDADSAAAPRASADGTDVYQQGSPPAARVASSSAYDEPKRFDGEFGGTSMPAAEGVGQPGPAELEGPQEASLVVEKRGPREAQIGKPCRFAIKVRNTGSAAAENVVLTDQTPAGTRLLKTNPTATPQDGKIVWRLGTLAAGEERIVEMQFEPLREGPLGSVATVTMDASASAQTKVTRPQLAIRVAAANRVLLGEEQIITIELHNPGTGAATGVMLVEDVPPQLRHAAGPALEYEVGDLQPGETRRIELNMAAAQAGHVVNAISAVADGDLRANGSVEFDVVAPSLAVSIDGPSRRYLERPASYTISVDNPGTAPAKDVRLVTHLPRGMEFVRANNLGEYDATSHSVYWSLAELPEGQRGEVEVVAMPVAAGEHTLSVASEARDGLEAEKSHVVRVEGVASLAFEVRDMADPIEIGAETTYEIRVLNEGTKAATNVKVRVEAPTGLRVVAAQGDAANRIDAGRAEFAALPRLEPGQKAAFRVRVTGAEAGDQRVTVLVESDDLSGPIRREESTRVFADE